MGSDAPWVTGFLVLFTSCLSKVTAASVSTAGHSGVPLKLYLQNQTAGCLPVPMSPRFLLPGSA